jgi:hypothetical protein
MGWRKRRFILSFLLLFLHRITPNFGMAFVKTSCEFRFGFRIMASTRRGVHGNSVVSPVENWKITLYVLYLICTGRPRGICYGLIMARWHLRSQLGAIQ